MENRTLELQRPLVSFDLETTGLNPREDRIVEISCVKLHPGGRRQVKTRRVNPTIPICAEATRVHGITDADVKDEPCFEKLARGLLAFLEGCDLTGFNLEAFDLPLLRYEFERAGIPMATDDIHIVDSRKIFIFKEPRTLSAAYRFYCGRDLNDAHTAEADAAAAGDILMAQVARYPDLPTDIAALDAFCHPHHPDWVDADGKIVWRDGVAVLGFGRHRNKSLEVLAADDPDYLRWIMGADFSDEVITIIEKALAGEFPSRPQAA